MTKKYMVVAVLLLCFGFAQVARSQDDENSLYEKAFNEKDPAKKQAALLEFVQKVKKGSAELETMRKLGSGLVSAILPINAVR